MSYLTKKNDRKYRRRARTLTFLITFSLTLAIAYSTGALGDLPELYEQFFGPEVATPVAGV